MLVSSLPCSKPFRLLKQQCHLDHTLSLSTVPPLAVAALSKDMTAESP